MGVCQLGVVENNRQEYLLSILLNLLRGGRDFGYLLDRIREFDEKVQKIQKVVEITFTISGGVFS